MRVAIGQAEQTNSVSCFGMLYGHRRHLDSVLPPLTKLSPNPTSTQQIVGRPVPRRDVDIFGLLHDDDGRLDNLIPPLSCHSRLLRQRPSTPSPGIPEQQGLQLPSKLTAFVSRVKKALSRKPKPKQLPGKVPCVARPSSELMIKPEELPSKRSFAGMPSGELVVIQVIRWNHHHQYGGGKPLTLQRRAKTLSSPSKIAALPISKILKIDVKSFDNKESVTLAESRVQESKVQGFGTLDTHDKPGEFADEADRSFLNEVNAVITAESNKGDGRYCNTCSTSGASANNSTTGQEIGSGTTNDSVEDGKECTDSSTLNAFSNEEHIGHKSNTGSTSISDALSPSANIAHQNEGDATANTNEEKGENDSHDSASDTLSDKENVIAQIVDENVTGDHSEGKGDGFCDHLASDAICDIDDITRPVDIADRAGKSAGKLKDCNHHSTSDLSFDTEDVHQVQDGSTTGHGEGGWKDWTESSNFNATSETSSAHESDAGVSLGNFPKDWAYGSVRSTPQRYSNEDTARKGDDGDAVETLKKERKDRADISTSDCLTIDESIQDEDASDGVEVDTEANRFLEDHSLSLPSPRDHQSSGENEAAVDATDGDSVETSSEKENSSPSSLPPSSVSIKLRLRCLLGDAADQTQADGTSIWSKPV